LTAARPAGTVPERMPADLIAAARDALPPDLYQRANYRIVRPFFSLGRAYYVYAEDGRLALFVRHPLLSLRERLLLYADEDETVPILEVRARQLISLYRCHDVLDAFTGVRLGSVRTRGLSFLFRDAWDILDPDDRVCGEMVEDTLSWLRRLVHFWPGRHHIEIGGQVVARLTQAFRFFRKEFLLEIVPTNDPVDPRFLVACALLAVLADARRES
jgi:hypothetical protein